LLVDMVTFLKDQDLTTFLCTLLQLVAKGEPVPLTFLAAEAGLPLEQVESLLRAQRGTDWDEQGRLLGFGLTQRPTPHQFVVEGRTLFTFCAADALIFPPILTKPASADSRCPETGQRIRIDVTPDAVTLVEPATAVVSQVHLDPCVSDIRAMVCNHGVFYSSIEAAATWRQQHPDGDVLPVRQFFDLSLAGLHQVGLAKRHTLIDARPS